MRRRTKRKKKRKKSKWSSTSEEVEVPPDVDDEVVASEPLEPPLLELEPFDVLEPLTPPRPMTG